MARQVNEVVTYISISAEEAEVGARRFAAALDETVKAATSAAGAIAKSETVIEQSARQMRLASNEAERLTRSLDPQYDAMRRLEQAQKKLATGAQALARAAAGVTTGFGDFAPSAAAAQQRLALFAEESQRLTTIQQRLGAGLITTEQAMAELNRTATHASATATSTGKFGLVAQQAGFQVADFVSQVGAGTNAMVAFGMQAGQLLGFFGPWGAVIGAGVATVSILAGTMQQAGKAAEDTGTAFGSYQKAMELAKKSSGEFATASGVIKAAMESERRSVIGAREAVLAKAEADLLAMQATAKAIEEASAASPELGIAGEQYSGAAERQKAVVKQLRTDLALLRAQYGEFNDGARGATVELERNAKAGTTAGEKIEAYNVSLRGTVQQLGLEADMHGKSSAAKLRAKLTSEALLAAGLAEEKQLSAGTRALIDQAVAHQEHIDKLEADDKARQKAATTMDRQHDANEKLITVLQGELGAREKSERATAIEAETRKLNAEATDEERKRVEELAGAMFDLKEAREQDRRIARAYADRETIGMSAVDREAHLDNLRIMQEATKKFGDDLTDTAAMAKKAQWIDTEQTIAALERDTKQVTPIEDFPADVADDLNSRIEGAFA